MKNKPKKVKLILIMSDRRLNSLSLLSSQKNKAILFSFFVLLRAELQNRQIEIFEMTKPSFNEILLDFRRKQCKTARSTRFVFTSKKPYFKKFLKRECLWQKSQKSWGRQQIFISMIIIPLQPSSHITIVVQKEKNTL